MRYFLFAGEVDVKCDMASSSKCLLACLPGSVAKEQGFVTFEPPNLVKTVCKKTRKRTFDLANSLINSRSKKSQFDSREIRYSVTEFSLHFFNAVSITSTLTIEILRKKSLLTVDW